MARTKARGKSLRRRTAGTRLRPWWWSGISVIWQSASPAGGQHLSAGDPLYIGGGVNSEQRAAAGAVEATWRRGLRQDIASTGYRLAELGNDAGLIRGGAAWEALTARAGEI